MAGRAHLGEGKVLEGWNGTFGHIQGEVGERKVLVGAGRLEQRVWTHFGCWVHLSEGKVLEGWNGAFRELGGARGCGSLDSEDRIMLVSSTRMVPYRGTMFRDGINTFSGNGLGAIAMWIPEPAVTSTGPLQKFLMAHRYLDSGTISTGFGTRARLWLDFVEPMFMAQFGPVRFSDKPGSKIGLNLPKTITMATLVHPLHMSPRMSRLVKKPTLPLLLITTHNVLAPPLMNPPTGTIPLINQSLPLIIATMPHLSRSVSCPLIEVDPIPHLGVAILPHQDHEEDIRGHITRILEEVATCTLLTATHHITTVE
ncbi:uncharacterized protein EDB91DRAFT_1081849 [Suillus paluster]|uniref:uncharacterized protein n=1 Tax=Suillus paluster TaxID=48578 RepID=UPI001B872FF4|nr:uncharacterized protein EDB91DRAFT_1081849 [Suillus paluster]KAG1740753.1 hypothetical protein EDB91DRAFT_1081849 [Suillus paluster]